MSETNLPPPGWYLDPETDDYQRFWDGERWTEHRKPGNEAPETPSATQPAVTAGSTAFQAKPSTAVQYASPGLRLAAFLLDVVFIWVGAAIIYIPLVVVDMTLGIILFSAVAALASLAFLIAYPLVAEGRLGQTYGKHVLGIKVQSQRSGAPIGVGAALGRAIVKSIGLYALGLGVLWIFWDEQKQGWHDKVVGSEVVTEPSRKRDNPIEHLKKCFSPGTGRQTEPKAEESRDSSGGLGTWFKGQDRRTRRRD